MKKVLLTIVLLLCLLTSHAGTAANPYSLFGYGNCVYFGYEMMNKYWPVTFNVPDSYDAWKWAKLEGRKEESYQICFTDRPIAGDFIIWPATKTNPYGHLAFITQAYYLYDIDLKTWEVDKCTVYKVLESTNYADAGTFPLNFRFCRYREFFYTREGLDNCMFLTYKVVTD